VWLWPDTRSWDDNVLRYAASYHPAGKDRLSSSNGALPMEEREYFLLIERRPMEVLQIILWCSCLFRLFEFCYVLALQGLCFTIAGCDEGARLSALTAFGLFAVTAMLIFYALEKRSPWFIFAFACACVLGSVYGFLQGAWPFGAVEAVWSAVALRRWWLARSGK
jgi:hypothetical protein